ncbi:MAG TPA: 30S ribosomal protein S6 [bacterium]|nr:30S ribosomal protein S6 [bacterium]HOL94975.1 30S ribosomal protein S6 [bacterium]HPP02527.1 30S ribosomal protein S6 [bacterium]
MAASLYELLYIVDSSLDESVVQRLSSEVRNTILEAGGEIHKESNWGTRQLAYPLKKKTHGMYINLEFTAPETTPAKIQELIKTRMGILRELILKVPKAKLEQEKQDELKKQKELEAARKAREEEAAAEAQRKATEEAAAEAAEAGKGEESSQPAEPAAEVSDPLTEPVEDPAEPEDNETR